MNKNQRTRNEVSKLVEKRSGNKIYEWFTNYNFVDENGFDGYIFKDHEAAVRYIYGIGLQDCIDTCDGACTDADWINILSGYCGKEHAEEIIKNGKWKEVVKVMTENEGPSFFLSPYSGGVDFLSDGRLLYY